MTILLAAGVGLACGVISGFGIGGGSLLMIWLTAVMQLDQHSAQGINLLFFLPTALAALLLHTRNRFIQWRTVLPAALAGCAAAALSAWIAGRLRPDFLRTLFGFFLLFVGARELFGKRKGKEAPMKRQNPVQKIIENPPSITDPNGSYTGKPLEETETPVQDVDDL